jgi:hypothetical protein
MELLCVILTKYNQIIIRKKNVKKCKKILSCARYTVDAEKPSVSPAFLLVVEIIV